MAKSKFYGLRGLKLNIAIAVVAGTDFALFGYGKSSDARSLDYQQRLTLRQIKVLWAVC
jgi:hypothetical protein